METEVKKTRRGRPRKSENWTADLLNERARAYFEKCDSRTRVVVTKQGVEEVPAPAPYSIEGLCVALDITTWEFRQWRGRKDRLGDRANKIHLKIMADRIEGALDGSQNSSFAQFMLKNNSPEDYSDKVEVKSEAGEGLQSIFEKVADSWAQNLKH